MEAHQIKKVKWYANYKLLWWFIGIIFSTLVGFIAYNQTLLHKISLLEHDIKHLDDEIDIINNSTLYQYRQWKWDIEDALKHAGIIYFEAGVLKFSGEEQ